jgi:hydroxysqualene dehydroxylase
MTEREVHVIGAGIAGLSAAVRLAEAGLRTIVHEATMAAGGRCRSFFDQALDAEIDNGNHLLLSGNHVALDYLDRIGSLGLLTGPDAAIFDFADLRTGDRWRLQPNDGRAPWWLFDRKRRAPGTSFGEYFAPLGVFLCPASATVDKAMSCEGPLYERLWRPILVAGLNTEPKESAATLAAELLRKTLLAGGRACRPLVATQGLSRTFIDPAIALVTAKGGAVRCGSRLRGIRFEDRRAASLEFETDSLLLGKSDAVVIALPPWAAQALLPDLEAPDAFRAIVNAHFRIAPPRDHPAILGVVGGLTQWIFAFPDRISVTISAADHLLECAREALAEEIWREVAELTRLPLNLPPWRIVKEKRATFAATPAQNAKRPTSRTRWVNVALAGDWIQTGLPATIEGAVKSGYDAASLIIKAGALTKTSEAALP